MEEGPLFYSSCKAIMLQTDKAHLAEARGQRPEASLARAPSQAEQDGSGMLFSLEAE